MRRRYFLTLALTALVVLCGTAALNALAGPYNRRISVSGGSPQRLSTVLSGAGYLGTMALDELTVCVPNANSNTLYIGQSDVSTSNGFALAPGTCFTQRGSTTAIDASSIYIRVVSTESESFSLRSR